MSSDSKPNIPIRREGYYHFNDHRYVSVTTVLQVIDKPALRTWLAKQAARTVLENPEVYNTAEKAIAYISSKRDTAADRGTDVHKIAARFLNMETTEEDKKSPFFDSIESFFEMAHPKPELVEQVVFSDKWGYAGTVDLVAIFPDNHRWVVDWKTGKRVYPEHALQVAAYAACESMWTPYASPAAGGTITPLPKIEKRAIVLLKTGGIFEFVAIDGANDFETFLAVKKLWEWMHDKSD